MQNDFVTASEICNFVYCKRAWWLDKKAKLPVTPAMLKGVLDHDALAGVISSVRRNTYIALTLLLFGIGILLLIATYFLAGR